MPELPASPIPLRASRALALHAQCLAAPPPDVPDADDIFRIVLALGSLQIDTLQVVARSHYLALWSRLGCYDPAQLDALLFRPGQRRSLSTGKRLPRSSRCNITATACRACSSVVSGPV